MKQSCPNKQMIRFRRWSRKGYAMFYSLGKCVTIGNLKKGIADASLGKQANVCTSFSVCLPLVQEDRAEDEWDEGMTPSEYLLQLFLIQPKQQMDHILCRSLFNIKNIYSREDAWCTFPAFLCLNINDKNDVG